MNEFITDDSKMGKSDVSLDTEHVEDLRDLPPGGTGEDAATSPCRSTDWNSSPFDGEFWGVSKQTKQYKNNPQQCFCSSKEKCPTKI